MDMAYTKEFEHEYLVYILTIMSLPLEEQIHAEYLTKEEFYFKKLKETHTHGGFYEKV